MATGIDPRRPPQPGQSLQLFEQAMKYRDIVRTLLLGLLDSQGCARGAKIRDFHDHICSSLLGFVLRDLSSPYFSLVAHGAQQRADELGFGLLFASSSNRLDREDEQLRRFRDLGTDGLIIVSMNRTYRLNE